MDSSCDSDSGGRTFRQVVNLTFHELDASPDAVDPRFRAMYLEYDRFLEILDAVRGSPDVVLTFDDGAISQMELSLPALQERDLTATFFVLAGRLDKPGFLNAADLRALEQQGMRVGLHGMNHVEWPGLPTGDLYVEIVEAKQVLEQVLGHDVDCAACPFGAYNRPVLRLLRQTGISRVYTSDGGPALPQAWLQSRLSVRSTETTPAILARIASARSRSRLWLQLFRQTLKATRFD